MKTRQSALYQRTVRYQRNRTPWLGGIVSVLFAALPLGVMLWAVPVTGIGIA